MFTLKLLSSVLFYKYLRLIVTKSVMRMYRFWLFCQDYLKVRGQKRFISLIINITCFTQL